MIAKNPRQENVGKVEGDLRSGMDGYRLKEEEEPLNMQPGAGKPTWAKHNRTLDGFHYLYNSFLQLKKNFPTVIPSSSEILKNSKSEKKKKNVITTERYYGCYWLLFNIRMYIVRVVFSLYIL